MLRTVNDAAWAEGEALRIPVTVAVHVAAWRGIVCRHCAIEVDAQHLSVEAVQVLTARSPIANVSRGHQQRVVGQNKQSTAIVNAPRGKRQQHLLVDQRRTIPIKHREVFCSSPGRAARVHDEHLLGCLPFWVHGHAQHSRFAAAVVGHRFREH